MPEASGFPINVIEAEGDYSDSREERAALSADKFRPLNTDVTSAAIMGLVAHHRLAEYRTRMAALPEFDIRAYDNLARYARAAWFAYQANLPAVSSASALQTLEQDASKLRERLKVYAAVLEYENAFKGEKVDPANSARGNNHLANDLVQYAVLFRSNWEEVQKHVRGITEQDVIDAGNYGSQLLAAAAERQLGETATDDKVDQRNRAWTVFDRAYDQCRRAIAFLRWNEGDVDTLIPSLRQQATARRRTSEPDAPSEPATTQPPTAPAAPAEPPSKGRPIGGGGSPFSG